MRMPDSHLVVYTRIEHSTQRLLHAIEHVVSLAHMQHATEILLQSSSASARQECMDRKHINVVSLA